jgi:hypothetical protein
MDPSPNIETPVSISTLTTQRKVSKGLRTKIDGILNHIVKVLSPDIVFLIGSMQRGVIHEHSDLDLVVIASTSETRSSQMMKVLPSRPHKEIPLDLHIFDRDQFEDMKNIGGLCFEAFHHGTVAYSKGIV